MFKKNISVIQTRPLSGKDTKQLKRDVQVQFPDVSEDEWKEIFPSKAEVSLLKLSNKAQAYSIDGNVLFFDPEGRGDLLVPTVYTTWALPHMLPALYTYSEVTPKVLGGADLFLQGIIVPESGLPHFAAGDLMVIAIPQNRFPFAVGMMETSSEAIAKTGLKGKGVKLMHHYPDQLWMLGDKSVPDPSFTPTRIFPQEAPSPDAAKLTEAEPEATTVTAEGIGSLSLENNDRQTEAQSRVEAEAPPAEAAAELQVGSHSVMAAMSQDELAEHCLFAGLQLVADTEMPIMTSDFYSKYMLPSKPAGTTMDIKKSSYKKLSKLLQRYEKQGLLSQKVIHKQDHISAINRSHELYSSAADTAGSNGRSGPAEEPKPSTSSNGNAAKLEISYCYRVPSSLRPIFGSSSSSKDELYSEQQVRDALRQYAAANALLAGEGSSIKLDRLLHGNLFNKKESISEGDLHAEDDLVSRLLGKLQLFHRIVRTSPDQAAPTEMLGKGPIKNIHVQVEDRQGGRKHVTKITHAESFLGENVDEFASILQRRFQTSASVQKLPGKTESGKEISLQGDLLQGVSAFLTASYGIDAKYITAVSKAKK